MANRDLFDHYRVLRDDDGRLVELGRGGTAVTYMAEDLKIERRVALKVVDLTSSDKEAAQKLETEALAATLLQHQNIAAVHDLGADDSHFFYAMEYVDGETLESWVTRHGPMREVDALKVALQISRALVAASQRGLTHRDIKPSNVMLCTSDDGEWPIVKVIDFGIATVIQESSNSISTEVGFHGTAQYASPEQAQQSPVDARSDVYSLGCTLWFALSGEPPFTGSLASIFAQHLNSSPPAEKLLVSRAVRKLLAQMLEKNAAKRPFPEDLLGKIQRILGRLEGRERITRQIREEFDRAKAHLSAWKPVRLKPALVACALLLLAAIAVAALNTGTHKNAVAKINDEAAPPPITSETSVVSAPSNAGSTEERPRAESKVSLPQSREQLAANLPRGRKIASFQGTDSSGRWIFNVDNDSNSEETTNVSVTPRTGSRVTKKRTTRNGYSRSSSARRSSSPRFAQRVRRMVGSFLSD